MEGSPRPEFSVYYNDGFDDADCWSQEDDEIIQGVGACGSLLVKVYYSERGKLAIKNNYALNLEIFTIYASEFFCS